MILQDRTGKTHRVAIPREALSDGRTGVDAWVVSQAPALTPPTTPPFLEEPASVDPEAATDVTELPDAGEE